MKILVLSYFDIKYGSKILLSNPVVSPNDDLNKITKLIELYDHGFFQHWFDTYRSANIVFEMETSNCMGYHDLFLVSLLTNEGNFIDDRARMVLEQFVSEFTALEKIHESIYDGDIAHKQKIEQWFIHFYNCIPNDIINGGFSEPKNIPDLMFEFSNDGTFINYISGKDTKLLRPPDEFIGKNIFEVLPLKIANKTKKSINETLKTGKIQYFEYNTGEFDLSEIHEGYEARLIKNTDNSILAVIHKIK